MLGYNRTITLTNIDVLLKIWPGVGGKKEQKRKKVAAFPTLLTMIVGPDGAHGTRFLLEFSGELYMFFVLFLFLLLLFFRWRFIGE